MKAADMMICLATMSMKPNKLLRSCLLALAVFVSQLSLADYPIETIELKARTLDEVLPVVRPLVGPDGTATGMGNYLVIKAAPERVREIRAMLANVDTPPKRLMIFVSDQLNFGGSQSGYAASADIKAGDGRFTLNSPGHHGDGSSARVDLYGRNVDSARTSSRRVQALEGRPAWISSGSRLLYHDATSGFYVVPRVVGDHVTLDIQQQNNRPGQLRGVINTQSSGTVVRGRLGEWINLGGIDTSSSNTRGGLGRSGTSSSSNNLQISVMVECLDCDQDVPRGRPAFEWKKPESE